MQIRYTLGTLTVVIRVCNVMKKWFLLGLVLLLVMPSAFMQEDGPTPGGMADLPGRIAYIGDDFNLYVLSGDDDNAIALTDDASTTRQYQWPTWANNDKLAYFCCDSLAAGDSSTEVYISPDAVLPGERVETYDNSVFQYALWSPEDCTLGDKCRDLAVLITGNAGLTVELIRDFNGFTSQRIGVGVPFYQSFSPDGTRMLWQRNNSRFDIYDIAADEATQLEPRPGLMQAPGWSPVDDRLLLSTFNEQARATDLVVQDGDETRVLAEALAGQVSSNWSPDGNYVAYRTAADSFGELIVVDSQTSEVIAAAVDSEVIAFYWSPDSTKLAYLTFSTAPGAFSVSTRAQDDEEIALSWWTLDVESGKVTRYTNFLPTLEMIYIINFFDQFAQSHRLWSPDSTHLMFAELTEAGNPVISLLDTTQPDAVPFAVADGVIGVWSFR